MSRDVDIFQKKAEEHTETKMVAQPVTKLPTAEAFGLTEAKEERISQIIAEINSLTLALGKPMIMMSRLKQCYNWSECTDEKIRVVVDFDILPMLDEYWFDDAAKLQRWSNILHGVFQ